MGDHAGVYKNDEGHVEVGLSVEFIQAKNRLLTVAEFLKAQPPEDTQIVTDALGRLQAIGPIFDPTAWTRNSDNIEKIAKITHAIARCRKELEEL